jgi:hypothetical protein
VAAVVPLPAAEAAERGLGATRLDGEDGLTPSFRAGPAPRNVPVAPGLPLPVGTGTTRPITVHTIVRTCTETPREGASPFIDVTLRNKHAIWTQSFTIGGSHPGDLASAIRAACPETARP